LIKLVRNRNSIDVFELIRPVDICDVLDTLKYEFEGITQSLGIRFSIHNSEKKICIRYSQSTIADIIRSIVHNSFSFCAKGDEISVWTGVRDGRCYLVFEDTGLGIKPSELHAIFSKEYTRRNLQKYSLNLFEIRLTIESYDGCIWAENVKEKWGRFGEENLGARFVIELPLA
jgi:signal transduction histidine kinase